MTCAYATATAGTMLVRAIQQSTAMVAYSGIVLDIAAYGALKPAGANLHIIALSAEMTAGGAASHILTAMRAE